MKKKEEQDQELKILEHVDEIIGDQHYCDLKRRRKRRK